MLQQQPAVTFTALDGTGSYGLLRLHVRRNIEAVTAQAAAASMRGTLGNIMGTVITRQSVIYSFVNEAPGDPSIYSILQRVGVFVFSTATAGQYAIIEIPGLTDSWLMTTGPGYGILIDQSKPEIGAFIAEMVSGRWCNKFGYVLTECDSAFLQVRR